MLDEVIQTPRKQTKAAHVELETHVLPGHAVSSIVDFAERERFDLLIIGFMGHSALCNYLTGGADRSSGRTSPAPSSGREVKGVIGNIQGAFSGPN